MNRSTIVAFSMLFGVVGITTMPAMAQDVLEQIYGQGVHAYFAGNGELAEERFNDAINAGSQDPRVYYFRGLNQIKMLCGVVEAGIPDFEQGAQLEMLGRRSGDVSKALQRIQGKQRMAIEEARLRARLAARNLQGDAGQAVPRVPGPLPPVDPTTPTPSGVDDPFNSGLTDGAPSPMPVEPQPSEPAPLPSSPSDFPAPTEPSAPASPNPFGDDASSPASPSSPNPFGDDASAVPPGTPAPDAANPFGDATTPATPAAPANPFDL